MNQAVHAFVHIQQIIKSDNFRAATQSVESSQFRDFSPTTGNMRCILARHHADEGRL